MIGFALQVEELLAKEGFSKLWKYVCVASFQVGVRRSCDRERY